MTHVLILGATGRTGAAILTALPSWVEVTAALRAAEDVDRLVGTAASLDHAVVDIADVDSLRGAMCDTDVVVNAIRLREDIAATELVALQIRLRTAGEHTKGDALRIVTVGGAGALRLPGGTRFWQTPAFPRHTLPRGRAHAALRDHLETGAGGEAWAYLIPPPAYDPQGPRTGRWEQSEPCADEASFSDRAISYADFGAAVAAIVIGDRMGTQLIAWPR